MNLKSGDDEEPVILTSFEKYGETKKILDSLLSLSLSTDPTPEEERDELGKLKRLNDIVSIGGYHCLLFTNMSIAVGLSRATISHRSASRLAHNTYGPCASLSCEIIYCKPGQTIFKGSCE